VVLSCIGFISFRSDYNQIPSLAPFASVQYLALVEESATLGCFQEHHVAHCQVETIPYCLFPFCRVTCPIHICEARYNIFVPLLIKDSHTLGPLQVAQNVPNCLDAPSKENSYND